MSVLKNEACAFLTLLSQSPHVTPIPKNTRWKVIFQIPVISLDISIDFTFFPWKNFKATETRVMNVLITAVSYRAEQRKRNQSKAARKANER